MSANEQDVRAALERLRAGEAPSTQALDPEIDVRFALEQLRTTGQAPERGGGFQNFVRSLEMINPFNFGATLDPGAGAARAAAASGILQGAVLDPIQGILQIPGLFTDSELVTDRGAEFIDRMKVGLITSAEERALSSGVDPEIIRSAHDVGNLIGFIAPVGASVKAASIILRAPINTKKFLTVSNLFNDMTAGALFGAFLRPEEELEQRIGNIVSETAMFGVGRILIGGIALPWKAYRNRRAVQAVREGEIEDILNQIRKGGATSVAVSDDAAITIARLLSEEEMIASSVAAQDAVRAVGDERALLHGIINATEAGETAGLLRNMGRDFQEVSQIIAKFSDEFPALKFRAIKPAGEEGFSVYFGMKGLSNKKASQIKLYGMYEGQAVEKNGVRYIVENPKPSAKGRVRVVASDGSKHSLAREGLNDAVGAVEPPDISTVMDDLYDDFRNQVFDKWDDVTQSLGGDIPEAELVRMIQQGKISLTDDSRRAFDVGGAIVYPEELGFSYRFTVRRGEPIVKEGIEGAFYYEILSPTGRPVGYVNGALESIAGTRVINIQEVAGLEGGNAIRNALGPGGIKDVGRQIVRDMRSQGLDPQTIAGVRAAGPLQGEVQSMPVDRLMRGDPSVQSVTRDIMAGRGGKLLTGGGRVTTFEDMVEAWARSRELPENAPDFLAMKNNFAQRFREEMWRSVPEEDMKVFRSIRDKFVEMSEAGDIPLNGVAHSKLFNVEQLPEGRVGLRDARTGRMFEFGSERSARDFLNNVIRSDKNMLGDPLNMGSGGMGALQRGLNSSDGIFTMDGTVPKAEHFMTDTPAFSGIQNVRDMLIRIEDAVGVPVFTTVFDGLDRASTKWNQQLEPWAKKIGDIWKPLKVKERVQVARHWAEIEGQDLSLAEAVSELRRRGLSNAQVSAFRQAREVFDALFPLTGVESGRYINLYYSRILPYAQKHGGQVDLNRIFKGKVPPEFQFFAEMSRTGELAMQDLDPAVVMHKYARSLFFKREVAPIYEKARQLVSEKTTMRFGQLTQAQREAVETAARRSFRDTDPVLAEPLRRVLGEYLNIIRGMPTAHQESFNQFARKFFSTLGVQVEDRVINEMSSIGMSGLYGAAMAFRPALVARNMVQTYWTAYSRLGGRYQSRALERALTLEGAMEAHQSGAIRATEAGLPFGEALTSSMMDRIPVTGTNPASMALAATIRLGLKTGQVTKNVARKGLLPYSAADDMDRAWVYHWQKMHTDEALTKFEAGDISWDKFIEDGLPFFHRVVKQKFGQLYNRLGREEALRWIGKQAADEADFIYGAGAQPAWMQSAPGRLLGMFGTWPIWALELYGRRVWNGTPKQIAAFTARTLAMTGAFSLMIAESGQDLWSWIAPASIFGYSGGPAVDYIIETKRAIEAPLEQKGDALISLASSIGRLAVPGQIAYTDVRDALDMNSPEEAALRVLLGRPTEDQNWGIEVLYDPENTGMRLSPRGEESLRSLEGFTFPRVQLPGMEDVTP